MRNTKKCKALLVINPKSRQGAEAQLDDGLARLSEAGITVERLASKGPDESRQAVRDRKDELDLVIVGGGDGTISSMAGVLYECDLPLAVLPLGTANDLARSLGLSGDLNEAFEVIIAGERQCIDLGVVNEHYFFNVAHLGLGVKVSEELTDEVKKYWGVLSYLKAFFAALTRVKQLKANMSVDGVHYRLRSIQMAIGNGRYYGGGNVVDEKTRIDDGKLSLYSLRPQTVWELLTLAPLLRDGRQHDNKRVFNAQAERIDITTGRKTMKIHADGEPVTQTPAHFSVIRQAIEVLAPALADNEIPD
ncbi:lipid kinase [Gilvimarinus sp. SDUM040013]|uniref:Lipid kinase n=1 Tax=Gilvimarinus gilvus TaxID=3058038 RepID=A0ABU4S0M0_9GAMM|nr:lipid kinase [Gilvimarinus sp. SDUM040013]MDO3386320.1 lipid kinase [Gilvimarinus sp. SDUM040013]MDX6850022.1 lipid kinase [Gilvimarinus sp. SDUM040013]